MNGQIVPNPEAFPFKLPPWGHQLQGFKRAIPVPDFALFFEQGTGKTGTEINILRYRFTQARRVMRTVIIAPIVVLENWKREFAVHSNINPNDIIVLRGKGTKRLKQMEQLIGENKIIITNFEALSMKAVYAELLKFRPEIVVVDESQRIKNGQATRTKAAIALGALAKHRYILSGTPILQDGSDIFSQFLFLDQGATFGRNFVTFRNTYFYDANAGMVRNHFPDWQPRPGAHEALNQKIYHKAMRVLKKDCLDLPPLVRKTIAVEMSDKQRKNYEEMRDEFITYLDSQTCVAQLALSKALRLQQIVTGYFQVTEENSSIIHYEDTPRIDALRELLEMLLPAHKVIVWACFNANYAAIEKMLQESLKLREGIDYVTLVGGMTDKKRQGAVDSFQDDAGARVIVANPQAGGVGINLTASSYSIYYSRNFSLEADLQSEARNHRGGSERHEKITRIDLVTPGTIDEAVLHSLQSKLEVANSVLSMRQAFTGKI